MTAAVRYCHKATITQAFNKWRKDVDGSWAIYIRNVIEDRTFERIFEEYTLAKGKRGTAVRVHGDKKSIAKGAFCMGLSLKRLPGGAESTRVLTIYESDVPHPDKILVQGEFGTIQEKEVDDDTFGGSFFKRVLVDTLQQVNTTVVKDRDLDDID